MFNPKLSPRIPLLALGFLAANVSPLWAQQGSFQRVAATTPRRQLPDSFQAPFELQNNLIFVTAELNGQQKKFILDSGAPSLVLNADRLNPAQLKNSNVSARGVGGSVRGKTFHVDSFNWQGLKWSNFDILAFPSPRRVANKADEPTGAIGYEILKDYEVTFDYGRKIVSMIRTDDQGNPVKKLLPKTDGIKVVALKMYGHIPVFPMKIDEKTYMVGLDSGAGGSMLDKKQAPDLKEYMLLDGSKQPQKAQLGGIGDDLLTSEIAVVEKATVGGVSYARIPFVFISGALDGLNRGKDVDVNGLVGYDFLKQYVVSLNYKKGTLSIYTKGT